MISAVSDSVSGVQRACTGYSVLMECYRKVKAELEGAQKIKIGSEVKKLWGVVKTKMAAIYIFLSEMINYWVFN